MLTLGDLARRANRLTEQMQQTAGRRDDLADERREIIAQLIQDHGLSYRQVSLLAGISLGRVQQEYNKSREATG